jgi:hypothetical protein
VREPRRGLSHAHLLRDIDSHRHQNTVLSKILGYLLGSFFAYVKYLATARLDFPGDPDG